MGIPAHEADGVTDIRVEPDRWAPAIADTEGPQLVVAGPGTGKTEFLVERAVHLVRSGLVTADQVQVLTFSRRAASELGRRINDRLGGLGPGVPAATFHSFAFRLLEHHGPNTFGWTEVPSLLTGPEQVSLVARLLAEEDPEDWPLPWRPLLGSITLAEEVADFILRVRERLLSPSDLAEMATTRPAWRNLGQFLAAYDIELLRSRRIDYGTLLAEAVECLHHPDVASDVSRQIRYVLVDEYQDTSPAQARLLELVAGPHYNLTAAADPYQSVYSFRGAEVANVADFGARFSGGQLPPRRLILTQSFRVPAEILDAALRVVAGGDLPGAAGPVLPAPHRGGVEAYVFDQASAEAEWIASEVDHLGRGEGLRWSDLAVLVRTTRHLLPELSRALERRRIPHEVPDRRLVDHPAVQLVFDLVAVALSSRGGSDPFESDRAMRRLLLGPLWQLPLSAERAIFRARQLEPLTPWSEFLPRLLPDSEPLAALIADPSWAANRPAVEGFWHLWTHLPQLIPVITGDDQSQHRAAFAAFSQVLHRQAERDPTVTLADIRRAADQEDFEAVPLLSLQRRPGDRLTLTTLHQAKGLEFEVVFIADAAEGSFPDLRRSRAMLRPELLSASFAAAGNPLRLRLQEEMRLAYTAMTRARRRVVWTATSAAIDEGERRPSRFLLSAAGVNTLDDLAAPPAPGSRPPVTLTEAQGMLRRLLIDPTAPAARRLAAVAVLADPPLLDRPWDATCFAGVPAAGPDGGFMPTSVVLSPSQADAYASCPRRYVIERRLQTAQQSGPYALFGSLLHTVLERAEGEAVEAGRPHADAANALRILDEVFETDQANFGSPVLNEAWKRRGQQLIENMYADWPGGDAVPVALERKLELELGGHRWKGRSDRVEQHRVGELRIVDYKTTKSPMSQEEASVSLQLGFYLLAAASDPELVKVGDPTSAELWYPLGGARRSFDRSQLFSVGHELHRIAESIAAEEWNPTPGPHCGRCEVRLVCPAWPEGREGFIP
ncbi:MAG TPA: ATP-dependent DNA helicase [Acidimicrobiia bacterium]|nr:ATP-dependent DNA helicase [Acidimicrobiia bacterium]